MTNEVYDIVAMEQLSTAVPGALLVFPTHEQDAPYVTVDGKRQVVKALCSHGFDLWTPRRNPRPGDSVTMARSNVPMETAAAFLNGAALASLDTGTLQ